MVYHLQLSVSLGKLKRKLRNEGRKSHEVPFHLQEVARDVRET